jgi:hypothetical protein
MINSALRLHPTIENTYIDPDSGLVMPQYTKLCLEWLKTRSYINQRVFEYGVTKFSLHWWRFNSKYASGITMDPVLANKLHCACGIDDELYTKWQNKVPNGKFDYIVINGRKPDSCVETALSNIKKGGYIIINKFHQESANLPLRYWKNANELLAHYPVVVFQEPQKNDHKTAVWQIVK